MNLRHLEWLTGEPVPDPEVILYEILPYSPAQADRIIRHLCALAAFDLGQTSDDPARAERVRQSFRLVVDAARARQAQLELDMLQSPRVAIPTQMPWWADLARELRAFPNASYDDQVELDLAVPRLDPGAAWARFHGYRSRDRAPDRQAPALSASRVRANGLNVTWEGLPAGRRRAFPTSIFHWTSAAIGACMQATPGRPPGLVSVQGHGSANGPQHRRRA